MSGGHEPGGPNDVMLPQSFLDQPRWWHGREWLDDLPGAVQAQCRRWELTVAGAVQHGANALAIPVERAGESLVLRMFARGPTTSAEIQALRFWAGRGTVRLIDADSGTAAMLLERVVPGTPARSLPVAESMTVLGQMMRRLAVPAPADVPSTAAIVAERARTLEPDWVRLARPFDRAILDAGLQAAEHLTSSPHDLAVNGDLHCDQVLRATREPWLTVDAVLYRGDIEYDLARILWTRIDEMADQSDVTRHFRTVVECAQLEVERARSWVVYRAVDYWLWAEDAGLTVDPLRCARLLAAFGHEGEPRHTRK